MKNFFPKSEPRCVTVYFPIVIGFGDIFGLSPFSIGSATVQHIPRPRHDSDPTFVQEVLHLRRAGAKRKGANHSGSFSRAQLISGVARKNCEQLRIGQVSKSTRFA